MTVLQTKNDHLNAEAFFNNVKDQDHQNDCRKLAAMMEKVTSEKPKMWGNSMVGFGSYHYKYDVGGEGDWFLTGFSPRKLYLTIYILGGLERYTHILSKLGNFKTGRACLYVEHLSDVDEIVLEELIATSVETMKKKYSRTDK